MVAAAGGDVEGAEDFFVLNVAARDGQLLRAEAKLAKFAGDGIGIELALVRVYRRLVAMEERDALDAPAGHLHKADGAVLVFHRELAFRAGRDIVNFARWEIRHIGAAAAEAVAFLRFLPAQIERESVFFPIDLEINLDRIRACHS